MNEILSKEDWETVEKLAVDPHFKKIVEQEKKDGVTSVFLMIYKLSEAMLKARTRIEELEDAASSAVTTLERTLQK